MYEFKGCKYNAKTLEIFGVYVMLMLLDGWLLKKDEWYVRTALDKIEELISKSELTDQKSVDRYITMTGPDTPIKNAFYRAVR